MWRALSSKLTLIPLMALLAGGLVHTSCTTTEQSQPPAQAPDADTLAKEWVGFHTEVPFAATDFHALASGLFGADAQAGKLIKDYPITTGVFVTAAADPSTSDQTTLTFAFDDGQNPRRTLAVAPASFAVGSIFVDTIDAAIAKMVADNQKEPGSGEAFHLEYRVRSSQGGKLSFGVKADSGVFSLIIDVTTPRTSLEDGKIGTAVESFKAYDTVAGTVWFHMTKDDFDFFVDHAYGKGATTKQNFSDFTLVPHDWLRLTVDPHLNDKFVAVGFELVTVDNRRVAVAKAPASILAGSVFQAMVDRNMSNMLEQEINVPGSSTPWRVPFYYDAPEDGGVVQVIAEGQKGIFSVAYSIESPRHELSDVPFVEYQPVEIPPPDPSQTASCEKLGDPSIVLAPKGTLNITFKASDVILNSPNLMGPLQGTIYCSVFHASDVNVTGPKEGAQSIEDFTVPNADLKATPPPTFTTGEFFAGEYQVLCAQDIDSSGDASTGDPVTVPIGSYTIACNKNPTTVEFAILNPQ